MSVIPAQQIRLLCQDTSEDDPPLIDPFREGRVHKASNLSYGLGPAGYDVRLAQDVSFPGIYDSSSNINFQIGSTIEKFDLPPGIMMRIHDKSTWARMGLSVFNSIADPGWHGYLTVEMVWHGPGALEILKGTPIAHCVFELLQEDTEQPYNGKYQDQEDQPVRAR